MAPPKYGDIGKVGNDLLNDDFKYDGKCEVKTKLESGVVSQSVSLFSNPQTLPYCASHEVTSAQIGISRACRGQNLLHLDPDSGILSCAVRTPPIANRTRLTEQQILAEHGL